MKENMAQRIIVALDFMNKKETLGFLEHMQGEVKYVKVGMELFFKEGPSIINEIKKLDLKIFLDLKLNDIPHTVFKAISALSPLEVDMINLHALGGREMMKAAYEALKQFRNPPILLAVTLLTSISKEILKDDLNIQEELNNQVLFLAQQSKKAGMDGVISSPWEVNNIKKKLGESFITVTPGIRLSEQNRNDQKRTCTPNEAFAWGSDYIVMGRAITQSKHPRKEFKQIINMV